MRIIPCTLISYTWSSKSFNLLLVIVNEKLVVIGMSEDPLSQARAIEPRNENHILIHMALHLEDGMNCIEKD